MTHVDNHQPTRPNPTISDSSQASADGDLAADFSRRHNTTPAIRLTILAAVLVAALCVYQFVNITGPWDYTMQLRGRQLAALVVAGVAVGVSTAIFQTLSGNKILTPGIMGFDALFVLLNTTIVFVLGSRTLVLMPPSARAAISGLSLTIFGVLLFRFLFRRHSGDLVFLLLSGVILGTLFASVASLFSRMLDPADYVTLQDMLFASFNTVKDDLLWTLGAVCLVASTASVFLWRTLDVIELGKNQAITLGVNYHQKVTQSLIVVTLLVAATTAMVGPMTFLGLVVAAIGRAVAGTNRHAWVIPACAIAGAITTVLGQLIVLHIFDNTTTLSVVVNLLGGAYVLFLLSRLGRS